MSDTRAPLHERLNALALQFDQMSHSDHPEWTGDGMANGKLGAFLRDHAQSLAEFAQQCEDEYVRTAGGDVEDVPTTAQGVALARFLRRQFRPSVHPGERHAHVSRGGAGLPGDYLHVRMADGYEGGIDRDGRVST